MKAPSNREDFKGINRDRVWKVLEFLNSVGAIDAKHITMQALACRVSSYCIYKEGRLFVLLTLCDAAYRFICPYWKFS